MKKLSIVCLAVVMAVAFGFTAAYADASAKFAASWSDGVDTAEIVVVAPDDATAEELLATIVVPQQKDLLIGVSAQIGLVTFTLAKKVIGAEMGEALASANMTVTLELRDPDTGDVFQTAAPGPVIFASRLQELKVSSTDMLNEISVSLLLDTTAAHHFNFLGVDLISGTYDVVAVFGLSAFAEVLDEDSLAEAKVVLGPRMVTVQEVRAVKDELEAFPM